MLLMAVSSDGSATEEPCCPKCGYALRGLPEFRCPECGTPFDREYIEDVDARSRLLQWERPELGRRLGRLSRTILQASLHPGRFYSTLSERKDRPLENAGSFIVACTIASICLQITAVLLDRLVFFLSLTWKYGDPLRALNTIVKIVRVLNWSAWFMPCLLILSMLLSVLLIAILLARVFRNRSGALRTMDLAAVFSPAIAFGTFIAAFTQVVLAISQYSFMGLVAVMVGGQPVVLLLLVWHFCRKLLALSRRQTAATVIACGIVQYGCACLVVFVLSQLLLVILL